MFVDRQTYIFIKKKKGVCAVLYPEILFFFFFAERQLTAVNLEVSMADVYGSFSGR